MEKNVIYLINAIDSERYPRLADLDKTPNRSWLSVCPESNRTEREQVRYIDHVISFQKIYQAAIFTNSVIIFNAFRVAIKLGQLNPADFVIHFYGDYDTFYEIHVDSDGRLEQWPEGFFDMYKKQLRELL